MKSLDIKLININCVNKFRVYQKNTKLPSPQTSKLQQQSSGGVLKNFAKFTGKQLCQSLFFNKVAGLEVNNKDTQNDEFFKFWFILNILFRGD